MDVQIRHLLTTSKKHSTSKGGVALQKAYDLLRNVAETRLAVDTPEAFGQDLYVICAEIAFQHGQREMAKECLKMYFMKTPPSNQFLCRAYLCQAQLLAPTTAHNPEQLEKAVVYLIKAINLSKENPRYHFLVYNASVLYWQFCRPFLKPAYRQYLARSLHQVVKALDDIDDKDYEWRAQLMIALIECHMDAGRRSDASHIATAAASFIKQHVPNLYKTVFGLMVRHQLVDPSKLQKDMKTSPELNIYYKICRLKLLIDQQDADKEVAEEMRRILASISGQDTESNSGSVSKPSTAKGRRSTTPEERPVLLIELARSAIDQNIPDVATRCVDMIKESAHLVKEQGFLLELEFVQCELMVKVLGDHQESYHKAVVEVRQQAIKRCEEAIVNAVRLGAPYVIQAGCVTMWNLCLPLLQPKLRQYVRRPLTVVAEALEDIKSLLMLLRCQVHMELAKCEEDQEQIQGAMTHLKKALGLDDGRVYEERLQVALHRLELRSELYMQPERAEDQAAMIIEQARKADSGTTRMKRSLLVRAGEALAPDAFQLVLDSESDTKEVTSGKGPLTVMSKLGGRARSFMKGTKKAAGHLRRRGNENDRERARLWGDLAKTARKQEVWDVCRVAVRFCLLHDDGRWKNEPSISTTPRKEEEVGGKPGKAERERSEGEILREKASSKLGVKDKDAGAPPAPNSGSATPEPTVPLYDKDLIRMLAEVNFIQGEALIHLLRTEGVELGELPNPPEDKRMRPKGYVAKKPEEDPDWIEYCDWIKSLTSEAVSSFLRAVELGVELVEPWVVCSAAAYVWNYNNHVLSTARHATITDPLTTILNGLKKVGHAGETILLVNICNALALGLIQPWLPTQVPKDLIVPVTDDTPAKKRVAPMAVGAKKPIAVTISNDAQPDLKKAVEVCEYAMKVTGGEKVADVVPINVRQPLLQTWVLAKQMLQTQVTKGLGVDDEATPESTSCKARQSVASRGSRLSPQSAGSALEGSIIGLQAVQTYTEGQNPMTRAMVGVELIQLSGNGIMEFSQAPTLTAPQENCPTLTEAVEMVAVCNWTDKLIELQLWTRLAHLAYESHDHPTVQRCATRALTFAETGTQSKKTARRGERDKHKYTVERELLAHASSLYGQSLVDTAHGKNSVRRNAMKQFLNSAKFACSAGNGALVMQVARLYWNASLALLTQPIERELLMEPLTTLLHCINITTDKKAFRRDELTSATAKRQKIYRQFGVNDDGDGDADPGNASGGSTDSAPGGGSGEGGEAVLKPVGVIGGPEDDLTLRAALYGVLFQSYADKGEWEAGLKAMDQAIADMPRTNHRLLIFKHMVTVKAKLGLNVSMSIQKFKDESEDYVAHMWRRVALCSKEPVEQLQAYQYAIEALSSPETDWQKFDYLLEFGQWLFCNEFPLQDALDQIEWAADILLNFKYESDKKEEPGPKGTTGTDLGSGSQSETKSKGAPSKKVVFVEPAKVKKGAKGGKGKEKSKSPPPTAKQPPPTAKPPPTRMSGSQKDKGTPDTRSVSGSDVDINASDYIPVHKEVIIGLIPSNPSLALVNLGHVRQLEGLVRAHVMMAEIAGRGSMYHVDYIMTAYGFVMGIWQAAVGGCGATLKEIAKNPGGAADGTSKGGSAKGKPAAKGGKSEAVKEKPKRKGPLDMVPGTTEEWAGYDVPDEVLDAFKHEMMKMTGINKYTITKPALTLHYLDQLVSSLRDLGFNHLALPVLALAEAIVRDLIKNRPLTALVHLRSQEVCLELNLLTGVGFHEKLADFSINEEEQARCREEMALWKERQVQVAKEETQLRETMMKATGVDLAKKKKRVETIGANESPSPVSPHLGKQVGLITLQEVWTDTAEVLIRQALYQPARQMLSEAYQAAQAFNDIPLQARILLQFGKLSYAEAQYGQAVNFASQAQKTYDGDENFWFETVMLMVDATVDDYSIKDHNQKARSLLIHALNVFSNLAEMRPNKISIIGYIIAKMESKLASIQARLAFIEHENLMKQKVLNALESARFKLSRSADQLVKLGYCRQAATIFRDNADVLAHLARAANSSAEQHEYYLKALSQYEVARCLTEQILHDSLSSASLLDLRSCSLPVQREYAETTLVSCSFMLEILSTHGRQQRNLQRLEQRKNSIVRAVEDLIRETPDYTESEREWMETTMSLGEVVLSHLTSVHSMVLAIPDLKCKTLCLIGQCLRAICGQKSPDPPSQWSTMDSSVLTVTEHLEKHTPAPPSAVPVVGEQKENSPRVNLEKQEEEEEAPDPTSRQYIKYSQMIVKLKDALGTCHSYLAQATEVLSQALSLALNNGFTAEASVAALELVECIGQYDPGMSTQFLALHQSCSGSSYMDQILRNSLVDPSLSQQAALYHQRAKLEGSTTTNSRQGPVYKAVLDSLNEISHSWKRLTVSPNHMALLKDFPPNFNFVVLQHSPDRQYLYGAVLDKPKPAQAVGVKLKQASLQASSKAKVVRVDTSPARLDELLGRFRWLKQDIMQVLLKAEYQRSQAAQRQKMLANLDESIKAGPQVDAEAALEDKEGPLEEAFLGVLQSLEEYLRPITALLDSTLRPLSATTVSYENKNAKNDPPPNAECVIILADQWLLQLPIEALACFQSEVFVSLSRDISLQFLHHKVVVETLDEAAEKAKREKEKFKPPTRLPGMQDAAKKQAKIIPLDRTVPTGYLPVDTHGFRYFVDPNLDCSETEEKAPIEQFEKMLELYEQQFTPRWLGVMGNEHTPSTGEYEIYILESSALIFYGMERFLAQLPPHKVAVLNLTDCQMVMLFDLAQTNKSFLRQSKVDVLKTSEVLALEKPVETALLLSLTGINCVCLNQWHCTLEENADKINTTMKDLLADGRTTGSMVKMLCTPYRRKVEEDPEALAAAEAAAAETGSAKGRGDRDGASSTSGKGESPVGDTASQPPGEPEPEPEPIPQREWFNMVCYGAPNIIVTQIGKV